MLTSFHNKFHLLIRQRNILEESSILIDVVDMVWCPEDVHSVTTELDTLYREVPSEKRSMIGGSSVSLPSLVEEDGKPHLFDKFLQSQPDREWGNPESPFVIPATSVADTPEVCTHTVEVQPPSQDLHERDGRINPDHFDASGIVRQFVPPASTIGSSSGYASESYYVSDTSTGCSSCPPGVSRSYFISKLKELEEEEQQNTLSDEGVVEASTTESTSDDASGKITPVEELPVRRTASKRRPRDLSQKGSNSLPQLNDDHNHVVKTQKRKDSHTRKYRQTDIGISPEIYRAGSPLSDTTDYYTRSPHISAYYTDDEGYVHMESAESPALTVSPAQY